MPDRAPRILAEIPRAARESIRISLAERHGQTACELRVAAAGPRGPMRETSRGFRVPLNRLGDVIAALQAAEQEARRLGLTAGPAAADRPGR